jgi:hypothetical protein
MLSGEVLLVKGYTSFSGTFSSRGEEKQSLVVRGNTSHQENVTHYKWGEKVDYNTHP